MKSSSFTLVTFSLSLVCFCVVYFCCIANVGRISSTRDRGSTVLSKPLNLFTDKLSESYGRIEMAFEANKGQTDRSVSFLARGSGYTLFLKPDEAVFALSKSQDGDKMASDAGPDRARSDAAETASAPSSHSAITSVLRMQLLGANHAAAAVRADELVGKANYFIGNDPAKWQTNISTYGRAGYVGVYKGVDVEYYGNQRQLEYDFRVAPGADYHQISLKFDGADSVKVEPETGDLLVGVDGQTVRQHKPIVYQESNGERREIEARFDVTRDSRVGFNVGDYDVSKPLVIDPTLVYSTFLGGSGIDVGNSIKLDAAGNAYVTGSTMSNNFPTVTPIQGTYAGGSGHSDVFVTKINPTGSAFVYSTYLGGGYDDSGLSIAVDSAGNSYLTGYTSSSNFPLANPIQTTCDQSNFYQDAFVTKINPSGSALVYSTCLGGSYSDAGLAIAVDEAGNSYITGQTQSANFPTVAPIQGSIHSTYRDAFVTKINSSGSALVYSTYLGGSVDDAGQGIAVDPAGNVYVTGGTISPDFPTLNPIQATASAHGDAFVTKINPAGSSLVYSTYLGGNNYDGANAVAVDSAGDAYITGYTFSSDFPTANPIQSTKNGIADAFVTKINASGSALVYSTYLGGSGAGGNGDFGAGIAIDSAGNAYVAGRTDSADFPSTLPIQAIYGGGASDAFVAKINPAGSGFVYSTYLGGSGDDRASGLALDSAGNLYVTGGTFSNNFPTAAPIQVNFGQSDAFVAKISDGALPTPTPTPGGTPTPTPIPSPTPTPNPIVISQIYGGGGTAGATYKNSFIELFNRGTTTEFLGGLVLELANATDDLHVSFSDSRGISLEPGQHKLIKMGSGGGNGADLPQPDYDFSSFQNSTFSPSGKVLVVTPSSPFLGGPCPLPNSQIVDLVGFGPTNCYEGSGPTATLTVGTAALRVNNGCTDTDDNASDFSISAPNPRNGSSPFAPCATPTPTPTPTPTSTPTPTPTPIPTPTPTPSATPTPPLEKVPFDFDGDGKTDLSVFRPEGPSGAEWWYRRSMNGTVRGLQFGISTDRPVAADFTGDGKTDIAVWRPSSGQWFIIRSEDGSFYAFPFGANGDIPVPADYDGDGKADAAVFRPSIGQWFILKSTGGTDFIPFGRAGDVPVAGDFDGDGKADIAIFRPSGFTRGAAEWWIRRSSGAGFLAFQFGISTDKAVPGDYTGDGKTDVAIYRGGAPATWYVLRSEDFSFFSFPFGTTGDLPVPGNYDGDAKWDAGVFRPTTKTWFVSQTSGGTLIIPFGVSTDVPLQTEIVGN